jgi:hypothetical protein
MWETSHLSAGNMSQAAARSASSCSTVKAGQIRLQRFNNDPTICREDNSDPDDRAKRYGLALVTKSITSTLLGSAIAETKGTKTRAQFEAVMQRPVDTFIAALGAGHPKGGYAGTPLEHLLMIPSGIQWQEEGWFSDGAEFIREVKDDHSASLNLPSDAAQLAPIFQARSLAAQGLMPA